MLVATENLEGLIVGGDFRILHPLAEGGIGAVYEAEQLSTGKHRALKLMHGWLLRDEKMRARFLDEARIAGSFESDHVVEVVSAGIDEAMKIPWIAMELLRGCTLLEYCDERGALPLHDCLEVMLQMRHGLQQAHERQLVHRDLKPDNVFVAEARRRGVPFTIKILDFGIAKWVHEARGGVQNSQAIGTPSWMAPEQLNAGTEITPATDVWALGLMAFWMLTAKQYWISTNQDPSAVNAVLIELVTSEMDVATVRAAKIGAAAQLPPGFDSWFAKSCARQPMNRFADVSECVDAFEEIIVESVGPRSRKGHNVTKKPIAKTPSNPPSRPQPQSNRPIADAIAATYAAPVPQKKITPNRDLDGQWWAAQAATVMVDQSPHGAEYEKVLQSRSAPRPAARPLSPGDLTELLWAGPAETKSFVQLSDLLGQALAKPSMGTQAHSQPGIVQTGQTVPDPVQEAVRFAALVLGVREPMSVVSITGATRELAVVSAKPWVLGATESLRNTKSLLELRCIAGWRVAWCYSSFAIRNLLSSADQLEQAKKAAQSFIRGAISNSIYWRPVATQLGQHRDALDKALKAAEGCSVSDWWEGIEATAARCALLCCADLTTVINLLDEISVTTEKKKLAQGLCQFVVSPKFSDFWHHPGLGR